MPEKVKLADGTEREFLTAEEIVAQAEAKAKEIADAQIAEAKSNFETEKAEAEGKAAEAAAELAETKEKLKKAEDKDLNFKNLREKNEDAVKEQEKNTKEIAALRETVAKIERQPLVAAKEQFIKVNAIAGDKNLSEKFDMYYDKFGKDAKTMEDVNAALIAAHAAATDGKVQPNIADQRMVRTGVNEDYAGFGDEAAESEASKEFGKMLGVTPEDKKKFGNAAKSGTVGLFTNTSPIFKKNE